MPRTKDSSLFRWAAAHKKSSAARTIQAAMRGRASRKVTKKSVSKTATSTVKRELGKRVETLMNFGRYLYQEAQEGPQPNPTNFDGVRYFLGNLGGSVTLQGETMSPMKTINAIPVNQNVAQGLSPYNQVFSGRSIWAKYMRCKINLTLPSIRTSAVGGADWQQMPGNFEYRLVIFKAKAQPAINNATAGFTSSPFVENGFVNEVGSTFGVYSPNSVALPDPTGAPQPWVNRDLMVSKVNTKNFSVLYEKRGRLTPGSSMNATSNNVSVTQGPKAYPSEVNFTYNHKINKKLLLELETKTAQQPSADPATQPEPQYLTRVTNYDTSIGFFLCLSPIGEGQPGTSGTAATWNNAIAPYIHISNSFTFTDM